MYSESLHFLFSWRSVFVNNDIQSSKSDAQKYILSHAGSSLFVGVAMRILKGLRQAFSHLCQTIWTTRVYIA